VVEFFEPINASATHIYHSALELSPLSSIVRRLYYHQQHTLTPKVLVGSWDSWDQGTAIRSDYWEYRHCSYTWSPCGQFIARSVEDELESHVEIRDGVTLQLLSTFTLPRSFFIGELSYSPDGSYLASLTHTSLIIWDIQTGGVTKEIEHDSTEFLHASPAWSLDGGTIGTIFCEEDSETCAVYTCDIVSGTILFSITLQSQDNPHIWAHNTSFHLMTTGWDGRALTIDIFEVGSTLTKIESFQINLWKTTGWARSSQKGPPHKIESFSPTTYHISVDGGHSFAILDVRSSEHLLKQKGQFKSGCFSLDGSLYAAHWSHKDSMYIWRYTSGHYTLWRELSLQKPGPDDFYLQCFSPILSSILGCSLDTYSLWVWQLDDPPTITPPNDPMLFATPNCCVTYMVTSSKGNSTVTITDLLSRTPCHFIDTGMEIKGLVLTGNVPLVMDSTTTAAWKLTEEGVVVGATGKERASSHDSIWTIIHLNSPKFAVKDQIAYIQEEGTILYAYSMETGDELDPIQATPPSQYDFHSLDGLDFGDQHYSGDGNVWYYSEENDTCILGWIADPDGTHRLWIPVKWRSPGYKNICWLHCVKTLWFIIGGNQIVIKF
jgi:hypothetical protein